MAMSSCAEIPISFDRLAPVLSERISGSSRNARANLQKVTDFNDSAASRWTSLPSAARSSPEAALKSFSELGYTRTSLRKNAQESDRSRMGFCIIIFVTRSI